MSELIQLQSADGTLSSINWSLRRNATVTLQKRDSNGLEENREEESRENKKRIDKKRSDVTSTALIKT